MFAEAGFEDEEGTGVVTSDTGFTSPGETRRPLENDATRASRHGGQEATHTIFFHHPGEDGFCAVAGAGDDAKALLDARTISGDSWVSNECRCLRCECLRVMGKLDRASGGRVVRRTPHQQPLVLLMLDLDNFGFNQFKSVPPGGSASLAEPRHDGQRAANPLEYLFVWAFFGSCFTRYHKTWPTEETVCEPLPGAKSPAASASADAPPGSANGSVKPLPRRATIWQRLVSCGRVHFTPCAGQSQAADNVMMAALEVFSDRDVILLTGDTKLIAEIQTRRRQRGRKSRRDNELDILSDRLTLIDVNDNDKRFVPVWRELEFRVQQAVNNMQSRNQESCQDTEEGP